jgi:hypothetical protein
LHAKNKALKMLDERRAHCRKLMHETAYITVDGQAWKPIVLLDISTNGLSIASPEIMLSGDLHSIRFTLPGGRFDHFAFITLLYRSTDGVPSGYRYGARFSTIDVATTSSIVDFLSSPVET